MKRDTLDRMKRAGVEMPSLRKVEKKKGVDPLKGSADWPPESNAAKVLPAVAVVEQLRADNEIYKARRKALLRDVNLAEKRELVDYIKAITDDGLDLILFAWGVLRCEGPQHAGVVIDVKAKIWAVEYLTDRAFGKAQQSIKIDSTTRNASDEELLKEVRLLQEKWGGKVLDANYKTGEIEDVGQGESESQGTPALSGVVEGGGMAGENS